MSKRDVMFWPSAEPEKKDQPLEKPETQHYTQVGQRVSPPLLDKHRLTRRERAAFAQLTRLF